MFPLGLERSKRFFESHGFHVVIMFDPEEPEDPDEQIRQRCKDIHAAFQDSNVKAIICTLGGSIADQLLPHLDYELIKANPKIFCGFSDITSLHFGLFTHAGLRTFYGPMAIDPFGEAPKPLPFTGENFLRVVTETGCAPLGPVPVSSEWANELCAFFFDPESLQARKKQPNPGWRWLRQGTAKGRIFGGCLEPIMKLLDTKFWPNLAGRILLVETAVGDQPTDGVPLDTFRSDLETLRTKGVFDGVNGLVVGRPFGYNDQQRQDYDRIVLDVTRDHTFPIVIDVDIGHTGPMITLPLNALVELDSKENKLDVLEPSVREE